MSNVIMLSLAFVLAGCVAGGAWANHERISEAQRGKELQLVLKLGPKASAFKDITLHYSISDEQKPQRRRMENKGEDPVRDGFVFEAILLVPEEMVVGQKINYHFTGKVDGRDQQWPGGSIAVQAKEE